MAVSPPVTFGEIVLAAHTVAALACMVRVLYKQRNVGSAFAWLILLFLFPLFGVAVYLLVGEPRLGTARAKRSEEMNLFYQGFAEKYLAEHYRAAVGKVPPHYHGISRIAERSMGLGATQGNAMTLLSDTNSIVEAMIADIESAQHSCLLAFYIIEPQGRIEELMSAVARAAERGVDCAVLADAVGSRSFFSGRWAQTLRAAGVEVHASLPVGILRTLFTRSDLRNHRKILVIDGKTGYTGSYNLVDPRYFKQDSGVGQWVDVMMRCTGPIVLEMSAVFFADLAVEADENLHDIQRYLTEHQDRIPELLPENIGQGSVIAQVIPSAPDQADRVIYETIVSAVHAATRRITITTPYFVPDEPLLTALTTAAKRGVEVVLILPAKVDSLLVRYASRAYYPLLLSAGVKIALFEGGLLHAKTMTIDEDYALFGTVNMDMRSFFLNLEISLAIYDAPTTGRIRDLQQGYLADCRFVCADEWQRRSKWWLLAENTVRLVSPLL